MQISSLFRRQQEVQSRLVRWMVRSAISQENSIVVMNCDLEFKSKDYVENIKSILL